MIGMSLILQFVLALACFASFCAAVGAARRARRCCAFIAPRRALAHAAVCPTKRCRDVLVQLPVCDEGALAVARRRRRRAPRLAARQARDPGSGRRPHAANHERSPARIATRRAARACRASRSCAAASAPASRPAISPSAFTHSRRALCRDLRRRLRAADRFPAPHGAGAGRRPGSRLRAGALGPCQPRPRTG